MIQFRKQVLTFIKQSGGAALEIGKDELNIDCMKKLNDIGLPLSFNSLSSLVVADLLIESDKIESQDKVVCFNTCHAHLDFNNENNN